LRFLKVDDIHGRNSPDSRQFPTPPSRPSNGLGATTRRVISRRREPKSESLRIGCRRQKEAICSGGISISSRTFVVTSFMPWK
jgi:hypothetical protein